MLNLVANELHRAGFAVVETSNAVSVYLKNRKPSTMEVETALEQVFEGIQFEVKSTNNAVIVKLQEIIKWLSKPNNKSSVKN